MKKKFIAGAMAAVVLVGGGYGGYTVYANYQEKQEVQKQLDAISDLQSKVNNMYIDSEKEFSAEGLTQENIDEVNKELKKLEGKEFTQETAGKLNTVIMDLGYVTSMFELQNLVDNLLDENGVLTEEADIEAASEKAEELQLYKEAFVTEQEADIEEANAQQEVIEVAREKLLSFFTGSENEDVKPDVTRTDYNEAKELVEKIKQVETKADFSNVLITVDTYLTEQEEKAEVRV